jgi:hypothetical protein
VEAIEQFIHTGTWKKVNRPHYASFLMVTQKTHFSGSERAMIRLPFNGVKGEMDSKQVYVQVPCVEMWGDACPILAEVRTWFKDKSLEEMGRKYWKKRSYMFQGFVRENPTPKTKLRTIPSASSSLDLNCLL